MSGSRVNPFSAFLLAVALAASLLFAAAPASAVSVPGPPTADPPGSSVQVYGRYYGAIALAMTGGAVGWSYDYGTKRAALRRAYRECKSRSDYPWTCEKIAWVRNGCLALAVRWNGGYVARYGWAARSTKRSAYWAALDKCGPGCVKRAYTCTTR